ncbi:MAG: SgcJ/EcaC family oxidoreductase [Gemmatimonadales bacterium]|jgi:uncharacterized protein (TIGR02246 family)
MPRPVTRRAFRLVLAAAAACALSLATPDAGRAQARRAATPHVTGAGAERAAIWREAAALLEHGARAWNGGDLDGFVSDYTTDATFVTSRGLVRGTAEIKARYAARFAPGAVRDSLTFQLLDVERLGAGAASLVATYVLTRGDSVTSTGPTSLVLKRVAGRWKIAHDHSS